MVVPLAHIRQLQLEAKHRARSEQLMYIGIMLMGLDALTTWYAMWTLPATELNPIMAWVMHTLGLTTFALIKTVLGAGMCWHLYRIAVNGHRYDWMNRRPWFTRCSSAVARRDARRTLWFVAGLMTIVVANNAIVIARHT